ncbi:MAG: glycoside hydrolase family 30 protein [Lachnospiraceae bacterium]|nr:glycoside hydrolase family 30 protein [Lachnospiraceae bacterium]
MKFRNRLFLLLVLLLTAALTGCGGGNETTPADATPGVSGTPSTPTAVPTNAPVTVDPDARQLMLGFDKTHQTIDGFGAGFTWYSEMIFSLKKSQECLDLLFRDAGFTILRFKNELGYSSSILGKARIDKQYYLAAKEQADARGEKVTVLYSSWSPQASLKSNNRVEGGGTLRKNSDGSYVYDDFAKWWADAVTLYRSQGIPVDVVSIQNECDFVASYDGCEFAPNETETQASYGKAFLATYRKFREQFGDEAPLMIAPETMTVDTTSLKAYLNPILAEEPNSVYAIAHHLYLGGTSSDDPNSCEPDSFLMNFMGAKSLAAKNNLKKWQTEFYRGTALQTANVINNSLVYEDANAYIFWGGVWRAEQGNDGMDNGNLLIVGNAASHWPNDDGFLVTGNYYAMRHFSQYVRPGFTRIDIGVTGATTLRASAYVSPDGTRTVIVLLNNDSAETKVQLPLDNYSLSSSSCYQSVFTKGYTADMCYKGLGALPDSRVLTLPGESVTTIVLDGSQN